MLQRAIQAIYPVQCLTCNATVEGEGVLCGPCWRQTPFVTGLVCDRCGVPLPGESDQSEVCDDCLRLARPWQQGRAALVYDDNARKLILALKHGDRPELAAAAAPWMARAGGALLEQSDLLAPIPLHWFRLLRRRYNQAAALASALGRCSGISVCPDLLQRTRATPTQHGKNFDHRFQNVSGALRLHPKRAALVQGARVLLIDDVMTSGATLAAAAEACLAGGAAQVRVLTLARAGKTP